MATFVMTAGHDSATWAGSSIAMTVGAASETWAFNAEIGGTVSNGYEVIDDFVTWANAGGRAWSGSIALNWSILEFSATGRTSFAVNYTGASPGYVVSSGLQTLMSIPASASGSLSATAGARSSFGVKLKIRHFMRLALGAGGMTSAGSFFTGAQAYGRRRPDVSACCGEAEAFALTDAVSVASNPRQAHHYSTVSSGWILIDFGKVKVTRKSRSFYNARIEVTQ